MAEKAGIVEDSKIQTQLNQDILPMSTTVPAVLDLDKAIETFRASIMEVISLDEMAPWDANELRRREQQIRQASLLLAGQCIALLIHLLANQAWAHEQAKEQTTNLRRPQSQGMGRQKVTIVTLGNVVVSLCLPYIGAPNGGDKKKRKKKKKKSGQRGKGFANSFYPFLEWLGMSERVTPLVWTTVAHQGMLLTSFAQAREQLMDWGIQLSEGRIQKLVYCFGEQGKEIRQQYIEQLRRGELPPGEWLRGKRVVISTDGGRARLRRKKRGKVGKKGRAGYQGPWKEPKLLTLYCVDEAGKRLTNVEVPITNDGTFAGVEAFMEIVEMHLVRLGIIHAEQVLLIADGAEWIWNRFPALFEKLGLSADKVLELIDFYHASEHLSDFAKAAFSNAKDLKAWVKRATSQLKQGQIKSLITQMETLAQQVKSKKKRESALKCLNYFTKQVPRFAYRRARLLNLPIGSGAIESLMRQVVNLRIKSTGKFWLQPHAEVILLCRCQWAAGSWESFCADVLQSKLNPKPLDNLLQFERGQTVSTVAA